MIKITFLGTGTSHGVPPIDCMINEFENCPNGVCANPGADPKHVRTRSSILCTIDDLNLLIDTSMDFRQQMLRSKVKRIDAVLYTHAHADHIFGLPDIRSYSFKQKGPIDIYGTKETINQVKKSFEYIFSPPQMKGGGIAEVTAKVVEHPFNIGKVTVIPIPVIHGALSGCIGFRVKNVAYIPDVKQIPAQSMDLLKGLDILIVDALRGKEHSTHLSLDESVRLSHELAPKKTYFTHMCHDVNYEKEEARLPENIRFAYDTLELQIP